MKIHEFAIIYLKAIKKKHKDYFEMSQLNLMNCGLIKGTRLQAVQMIKQDLPFDISRYRHYILAGLNGYVPDYISIIPIIKIERKQQL